MLPKQDDGHGRRQLRKPLDNLEGRDRLRPDLAEDQLDVTSSDLQAGAGVVGDLNPRPHRRGRQQASERGQKKRRAIDQQQIRPVAGIGLTFARQPVAAARYNHHYSPNVGLRDHPGNGIVVLVTRFLWAQRPGTLPRRRWA